MPQRPGNDYKYSPEICDTLIDHMSRGLSFDSFAGEVGVCRKTLYNWLKDTDPKFDAFRDAKGRGDALSLLFWEKVGIKGTCGKLKGFNSRSWQFNMQNRHKWSERQEHKHTGEGAGGAVAIQFYLPDNGRDLSKEEASEGQADGGES